MCRSRTAVSTLLTVLPSFSARAKRLQFDVLRTNLDVKLIVELREDRNRCSRRVDAPARFSLGDTLDAVDAAFVLEQTVGALAVEGDADFFEAA